MHTWDRRSFLRGLTARGVAGVAAGLTLPAWAAPGGLRQPISTGQSGPLLTGEANDSVLRGLDFLADSQLEDGALGLSRFQRNVAVVSLAGLAFMSRGSTPGRGRYGTEIERCASYILQRSQPSGYIADASSSSHGPMYGHGFATLFLAELFGMSDAPEIRERLEKAVQLIVSSQNASGGWRYYPDTREADISVTICQIMALRAARNAGIYVDRTAVIEPCIDYVKSLQNPDGGFGYMFPGDESGFPRSAAGVVALYSAGIYQSDEIDRGLEYLAAFRPNIDTPHDSEYFYYGHYYAVQAMWHAGGAYWTSWYPAIRDNLIAHQSVRDGSWEGEFTPQYSTAMACIVLQMPNNYLPIFQR